MAIDSQRRSSAVAAMNSAEIEASACFSPPDVLLISGYWPVVGKSIAVLTRETALAVLLPEDEMELAEATGAAHLIPYKSGTPAELWPLSPALVEPGHDVVFYLQTDSGQIGARLGDGQQAASYHSADHFRSLTASFLQQAFPHATVVAADKILGRLKAVLTCIELEQLRSACRLAAVGFRMAEALIEADRTEAEIAAESNKAFNRAVCEGWAAC